MTTEADTNAFCAKKHTLQRIWGQAPYPLQSVDKGTFLFNSGAKTHDTPHFYSFLRILKGLFSKKSLKWGLGQSPKSRIWGQAPYPFFFALWRKSSIGIGQVDNLHKKVPVYSLFPIHPLLFLGKFNKMQGFLTQF